MYDRDPGEILTRNQRIDAITPQVLQDVFKKYFPAGPLDSRDARPLSRAVTARAPLRRCPAFVTKRLFTTYPTGVRPLIDTRTGAL